LEEGGQVEERDQAECLNELQELDDNKNRWDYRRMVGINLVLFSVIFITQLKINLTS
jgi:hypothetical protein